MYLHIFPEKSIHDIILQHHCSCLDQQEECKPIFSWLKEGTDECQILDSALPKLRVLRVLIGVKVAIPQCTVKILLKYISQFNCIQKKFKVVLYQYPYYFIESLLMH